MKKHLILFICTQTLLAVSLIVFCLAFLKNTSLSEVHTVQNLAGALNRDFPETESTFMQALLNPSPKLQAEGALSLSRYGYEEISFLGKSPFYRQGILVCLHLALLFFLLFSVSGLLFFYSVRREQRAETAKLRTLLELCLSDDYGFLEEFQDTHPLKEDDLSDAFLKLAKKLRLKSEILAQEKDNTKTFVTDISHQLKTPLAALKTCLSIYMEADTPKEKEEFGERCKFQLEKLENLTASLINISRLESEMIRLQRSAVSFTDILVDAVNSVYEKAATKHIEIDTEEFEETELFLDRKWTAEALFNILDNAVKYSPAESLLSLRAQKFYSFLRVEIEDQGIGIPREEYNNIFKRFYRGRQEAVQKAEGAGVGLYLARKILEEQGGTLSVKAARTQGSIFVVQLPLSSFISP